MSIRQIPVQPLTQEAFAPYGTVIDLPEKPENYELRSSDRFDFFPKLCTYQCDSGIFQIGVSTLYQRPYRTVNMERHYHTQELMVPLTNPIIIVFSKNKGLDPQEEPDINEAEAFLINTRQGVVVDTGVWHWTPIPGSSAALPRTPPQMTWMYINIRRAKCWKFWCNHGRR